jgi:selenocysteine lyase/cysteine desulfurase
MALPVKELCRLARRRGILTLIDGAQSFGALKVNLHDIGCDFYTGSAHKWLVGPKESGVLYVRKERIEQLWPSVVGSGWEEALKKGAQKFETLGQRDDATIAATGKAVEFLNTIGMEQVESRIRELALALKTKVQTISKAKLYTPLEPQLSAGVVVFGLKDIDPQPVYQKLYKQYHVRCAAMGGAFTGVRFCPHIYNLMDEVDRVVAAVKEITKS